MKKKIIFVVSIMGVVVFVLLYNFVFNSNDKVPEERIEVEDTKNIMEDVNDLEEVEKVYVDIKGEVNNPGVYEIEADKKVIDQTCPIMIQRLRTIFQRNPLISMGI